ncbi:MAG: anti-sigma factor [Microbacterium sp.]
MPHIDPERLALFALGEPVATPEESEHLADCAICVDDLAALRHVAVAGRASMDVGELESPPEAVWARIVDELALGAKAHGPSVAVAERSEPVPADAEPQPAYEPATRRSSRPDAAPARRGGAWRVWALAASFALIAGVGLGAWAISQQTSLTEIAEASLAPFPDHPDAEGTAIVEEQPDGSLAVRVALSADSAPDTFREVWLIKADASDLVSLGVLEGTEQTFSVPAGVDLSDFVLVDVSQEPLDGDETHSGDSIVRGELEFS